MKPEAFRRVNWMVVVLLLSPSPPLGTSLDSPLGMALDLASKFIIQCSFFEGLTILLG